MKLTNVSNACAIYESNGKKLLADPWLVDGAFYGSWFHYPPLRTKPSDVADYDYLYLSHLHPDHYCKETIKDFDRTKPVILYDDGGPNFLERMIKKEGFLNIIKMKDKEVAYLDTAFKLTMFGPFTKHPFFDCKIGNVLDSALVIEDNEHCIINTNDNTPSLDAALMLKERFGEIYVAQLNYNAAGPYPSCFYSLTEEERLKAHSKLLERNLKHMVDVANILKPKFVQPFAGSYIVGGPKWTYNTFLGTTTLEHAVSYINKNCVKSVGLALNEGRSIGDPYEGVNQREKDKYIFSLRDYRYTYMKREALYSEEKMYDTLTLARESMFRKQQQLDYVENYTFYIHLLGEPVLYRMNLGHDKVERESMVSEKEYLLARLDKVLMEDILTRKAHWNNAEIGCHIDFYRTPDIYKPDLHTFLSFLHV